MTLSAPSFPAVADYRHEEGARTFREQILANQKRLGVIPQNTKLTGRIDEIPSWDSLTSDEQRLYARQMEAFFLQKRYLLSIQKPELILSEVRARHCSE